MRAITSTASTGIAAGRGLGREHDRVGAVEDRGGHVADLGAGRAAGACTIDSSICVATITGTLASRAWRMTSFWMMRHVLERHVDAEVAARHHHRVDQRQDAAAGSPRSPRARAWPRSGCRRPARAGTCGPPGCRRPSARTRSATKSTPCWMPKRRSVAVLVGQARDRQRHAAASEMPLWSLMPARPRRPAVAPRPSSTSSTTSWIIPSSIQHLVAGPQRGEELGVAAASARSAVPTHGRGGQREGLARPRSTRAPRPPRTCRGGSWAPADPGGS